MAQAPEPKPSHTSPNLAPPPPRLFKDNPHPPPPPPGLPLLKLTTHNVNKQPPGQFIVADLDAGCDILCYQELKRKPELPLGWAMQKTPPKAFTSIAVAGGEGAALVVAPRLAPYAFAIPFPCPGALCLAELHLPGQPVILVVSVCAQPPQRTNLEKSLDLLFNKYPKYIMCGDFNAQLTLLDSYGATRNTWSWLTALVHNRHLAVDVYWIKHPTCAAYTRYRSALLPCDTRIDLILISDPLFAKESFKLKVAEISHHDTSSDHHPVYCLFRLPSTPEYPPPPDALNPFQTSHTRRRTAIPPESRAPGVVCTMLSHSGLSPDFS